MFLFAGTFWIYLGFSTAGLFFLILTLPETKGKTLEEIEGIFAKPWFGSQGTLKPYKQKDTVFNYTHIDGTSADGGGDRFSSNHAHRVTDNSDIIDTRLCTNRMPDSVEESSSDGDSDSPLDSGSERG